jgi:hypothetical protein
MAWSIASTASPSRWRRAVSVVSSELEYVWMRARRDQASALAGSTRTASPYAMIAASS